MHLLIHHLILAIFCLLLTDEVSCLKYQDQVSKPVEQPDEKRQDSTPYCHLLDRKSLIPLCLESDYEKHVRPGSPREPIKVEVHLRINEIEDVSPEGLSISYHVQIDLRWVDPRVRATRAAFDTPDAGEIVDTVVKRPEHVERRRQIDTDYLDYLWVPDLMIYNLKHMSTLDMLRPQSSLFVYRDSTIEYRFTVRPTVGCSFDFAAYPIDHQECKFFLGSFSLPIDEIVFQGSFIHPMEHQRPLPVEYDLVKLSDEERFYPNKTATKKYSVTGFKMQMVSRYSNVVIQVYVPAALFAYVSFISFMIDRKEQAGRLTMLVLLSLLEVDILANLSVHHETFSLYTLYDGILLLLLVLLMLLLLPVLITCCCYCYCICYCW